MSVTKTLRKTKLGVDESLPPTFARTTLTNEEIIAELGWSKEVIKAVIGVTPTTMRPPYGGRLIPLSSSPKLELTAAPY